MLRKKWIARETSAVQRDARRTVRYAVLIPEVRIPKLNANQQTLLAELAGAGGELALAELRRLELPDSTLGTLVRRGLVRIEERPADFHLSSLKSSRPRIAHTLNPAQQAALEAITASLAGRDIQANAAARSHRLRQDRRLPGSDADSTRRRTLCHPARP